MAQHREKHQTKRPEREAESRDRKRGGPEEPAGKPERTTPERDVPQGPPDKDRDTPDPPREFNL